MLSACGIGTDLVDETPTVRITPRTLALALDGEPAQVGGELFVPTEDGDVIVGDAALSFTSDNPSVVTVAASGLVSAVGPGQARITGTYDGDADWTVSGLESLVTVVGDPDAPAQVTVTEGGSPVGESTQLSISRSLQLSVDIRTFDDRPVSDVTVSWASSNPAVAEVDAEGLVTPLAVGNSVITASADGISSLPFTVTVFDPEVSGRSGVFSGLSSYDVFGAASLSINADGNLELTLSSDFSSEPGPDLDVVLATGPSVSGSSVNLGDLQSTRGEQTYAVPAGATLDQFNYVIIQCVRFGVAFGRAELQ